MSKSYSSSSSTLLSSLRRDDEDDYEEEGSPSLRSLRSRALIGPRSAHLFRGSSANRSSLGLLRLTSVDESSRESLYQPGSNSPYLKANLTSSLHLQTTTTSSSSDQEDSLLLLSASSSTTSSSTSSPAGRITSPHHVDLQRTDSGNSSLSPSASTSDSLSHSSSNDGTGSFNSTSLDHAFSSSAEECIEEEDEDNEGLIHISVYVPETQREVSFNF